MEGAGRDRDRAGGVVYRRQISKAGVKKVPISDMSGEVSEQSGDGANQGIRASRRAAADPAVWDLFGGTRA